MSRRMIRDHYDLDGKGESMNGLESKMMGETKAGANGSLGGCVTIVDCKGCGMKNLVSYYILRNGTEISEAHESLITSYCFSHFSGTRSPSIPRQHQSQSLSGPL